MFFKEIRHAFRLLARSPGFTAIAALSLALGVGANGAIFSLHDALLFRPRPRLLLMRATGTLGLLGLALALVGLYGVVAYSVARRTREIGIRMAIGAGRVDVLKMVLRQGLMLSMAGIVVGGVASVFVARLVTTQMVGLGAPSPATYIIVPVMLICLTMAASYFPARRASRVDPLRALRALGSDLDFCVSPQ